MGLFSSRSMRNFGVSSSDPNLGIRKIFLAREAPLLTVLHTALRTGAPLGPTLAAYAQSLKRRNKRLEQLAERLTSGYTFHDALGIPSEHDAYIPPVGKRVNLTKLFTRETLTCILVGEASGQLNEAVRIANERSTKILTDSRHTIASAIGFFATCLAVCFLIFVAAHDLIYDVVVEYLLESADKSAISISSLYPPPESPLPLWVGLAVVLIGLCYTYFEVILTGHFALPRPFNRHGHYLFARDLPLVYRLLGTTLADQTSLEDMLEALHRHHYLPWVRTQSQASLKLIRDGVDWITALRKTSLLNARQADYLKTANSPMQQARMLEYLARQTERDVDHRVKLFLGFFRPLATLLIAAIIFFQWSVLFGSLVGLIEFLAQP